MDKQTQIRLSQVVGRPVAGPQGAPLGCVDDIVVRLEDGGTPTVKGTLSRGPAGAVFVPRRAIAVLDTGGVHLVSDTADLRPFERRPGEVLLACDVLGRAVIDVERGRLVRVGDVVLDAPAGDSWHLLAVATAPSARLRALRRLLGRRGAEEVIAWLHVEPLVGHVPTARRGIVFRRLSGLKPAEIADLVEQASHQEGRQILEAVGTDEEFEADVFEELDEGHRTAFLKERSDAEAAGVLARMEPDHAADLLLELPQERRRPILEALDAEQQAKVRHLLGYHPETAGGLMNNEFVALSADVTIGVALARLRELAEVPAILTDVYVVEQGRLVGSLPLSRLLRADPEARLCAVMQTDPEAIFADADLPSVAVHMADYNLASVPVIDAEGRLIGIVTYDDLIGAMLPEEWRWRGGPVAARVAEPADNERGPQPGASSNTA